MFPSIVSSSRGVLMISTISSYLCLPSLASLIRITALFTQPPHSYLLSLYLLLPSVTLSLPLIFLQNFYHLQPLLVMSLYFLSGFACLNFLFIPPWTFLLNPLLNFFNNPSFFYLLFLSISRQVFLPLSRQLFLLMLPSPFSNTARRCSLKVLVASEDDLTTEWVWFSLLFFHD